jgi:hypothetical protein
MPLGQKPVESISSPQGSGAAGTREAKPGCNKPLWSVIRIPEETASVGSAMSGHKSESLV